MTLFILKSGGAKRHRGNFRGLDMQNTWSLLGNPESWLLFQPINWSGGVPEESTHGICLSFGHSPTQPHSSRKAAPSWDPSSPSSVPQRADPRGDPDRISAPESAEVHFRLPKHPVFIGLQQHFHFGRLRSAEVLQK